MQKKKSGVKKCLEICAIKGGGVGPLMANAILNFHFDYLTTSLMAYLGNAGKSTFVFQGIRAFKVIPGETLGETLGE